MLIFLDGWCIKMQYKSRSLYRFWCHSTLLSKLLCVPWLANVHFSFKLCKKLNEDFIRRVIAYRICTQQIERRSHGSVTPISISKTADSADGLKWSIHWKAKHKIAPKRKGLVIFNTFNNHIEKRSLSASVGGSGYSITCCY